jgi:hypothetical protein
MHKGVMHKSRACTIRYMKCMHKRTLASSLRSFVRFNTHPGQRCLSRENCARGVMTIMSERGEWLQRQVHPSIFAALRPTLCDLLTCKTYDTIHVMYKKIHCTYNMCTESTQTSSLQVMLMITCDTFDIIYYI